MKIFFPVNGGGGCHVVVGRGFLEGFNDDHPGSNLKGLGGVTFSFGSDFKLVNVQVRNGDLKTYAGLYLGKLASIARTWAQDRKALTNSGVRPALRSTPVPESEMRLRGNSGQYSRVQGIATIFVRRSVG